LRSAGRAGRGAAQEQVAEGRAQVFFDGQLHRLGAQARAVALLPQAHQLAERAATVLIARRQAFAVTAEELELVES